MNADHRTKVATYKWLAIVLWLVTFVGNSVISDLVPDVGRSYWFVALIGSFALAVYFSVRWFWIKYDPDKFDLSAAEPGNAGPSTAEIRRPRFRVKDLLIATTFVAIGVAMLYFMPTHHEPGERPPKWGFWYVVASLGLIGAGFGTPIHRPWKGAISFTILVMVSMFLFAMWDFFW